MTGALGEGETARLFAPLGTLSSLGIAVSGGADSLALMVLLARWARAMQSAPALHVFTVDHGLRTDAAGEARQVGSWAAAQGLPHRVLCWSGAKPARNLQAAAREARYRLMAEACHESGIPALATAHHLEDQAETVLLRLARGSGVDGLAAMAAQTPMMGLALWRPLLEVPRERLRATLQEAGQDWIEDPSNQDTRHARVRMRALAHELAGEGLDAAGFAATARRMRRAREALEAASEALAARAMSVHGAGYARIDAGQLAAAPEEIGLRLLARALMSVGGRVYRPRLERLERLHAVVTGATDTDATLAGCRISLKNGHVLVRREAGRAGLPEIELGPDRAALWDGRFHVRNHAAGTPVTVRALGADGWRRLSPLISKPDIPVDAIRTSVSFWRGEALLAAPCLPGAGAGDALVEARFVGGELSRAR